MTSRYSIIPIEKLDNGVNILRQTYYPAIGLFEDDTYIITSNQDRFDLIALDFWGDMNYWWVIPMVNNLECDSMYPPIGIQIRIPQNIQNIINLFQKENE